MEFHKYHGMGNDYIVLDPSKLSQAITMDEQNIRLLCHRSYGVGSDGILYGPFKEDGLFMVKIFNPDGSEAEKSGNGIRIFAQYLWDQGYVAEDQFKLVTKGGIVGITRMQHRMIWVNMGNYSCDSKVSPVNGASREVIDETLEIAGQKFTFTAATVGNPHCVIILPKISSELAYKYGPEIEIYPLFPNKTNVQFVEILDRNNIKIEIWERGAGYTLASGSSSTASVCVAFCKGLVDSEVTVHMPGGELLVEVMGDEAFLTGPVQKTIEGNISPDLIRHLNR